MKVTVEFSDSEIKNLRKLTGENKKGPAVRKVVVDALNMQRRREILAKFVSGEWSADVEGFEERRKRGRDEARQMAKAIKD